MRNPSAFARHQEALQASEVEIKEFVGKLNPGDKDKLLIWLLSQGRGSVEFAKNVLSGDDPEVQPPPENDTGPWCVCGVCRRMPDEQENV